MEEGEKVKILQTKRKKESGRIREDSETSKKLWVANVR